MPLATQAIAILRELNALTGSSLYVFPGARDRKRPMSEAAINAALRRLGYDTRTEIAGHGFRATARTIPHEELEQKPEVIEHQLAHAVSDNLGGAYNRTRFIKKSTLHDARMGGLSGPPESRSRSDPNDIGAVAPLAHARVVVAIRLAALFFVAGNNSSPAMNADTRREETRSLFCPVFLSGGALHHFPLL